MRIPLLIESIMIEFSEENEFLSIVYLLFRLIFLKIKAKLNELRNVNRTRKFKSDSIWFVFTTCPATVAIMTMTIAMIVKRNAAVVAL